MGMLLDPEFVYSVTGKYEIAEICSAGSCSLHLNADDEGKKKNNPGSLLSRIPNLIRDVKGKLTRTSLKEGLAAIEAELQGYVKNIRRPNAALGENVAIDFVDDNGYVEVKTAWDPAAGYDSIAKQVGNVAKDIRTTSGIRYILDLNSLNATDKVSYLSGLESAGIDIGQLIILNP